MEEDGRMDDCIGSDGLGQNPPAACYWPAAIPATSLAPWSDLLPELLGRVIANLPFPADLARLRAVCRAWRSAARQHVRQLPWIVLPDGSFCTVDDDGGAFFGRIPSLPENTTCLSAAADGWLALDCTDDVFRRTPLRDKWLSHGNTYQRPRADVMHGHAYLLHNPFSGETVPLLELDAIVGDVAETFEIRKVLMRSSNPDDVVAVTTNNCDCNIIVCHPGKGRWEEHEAESSDDEAWDQEVEYSLNGDDGEEVGTNDKVPYEPKDYIRITRRLVESCGGRDLLMVRHHRQSPPFSHAYTRKVEVFKADIDAPAQGGRWPASAAVDRAPQRLLLHHRRRRIPGLPGDVTCLGATTTGGSWLALDRTDNVFRRTNCWDAYRDGQFLRPRSDAKHDHTYLLHHPFSGKTVPLPGLDAVAGHVAETFEIRKVLMRSEDSPDNGDGLVIVTTNSKRCSIIVCFLGKATCWVPPYLRVVDVAFYKDKLYGMTLDEDLLDVDFEMTKDEEVPHEPKDYITTRRWLVESCGGQELLMVRRQVQSPAFDPEYIRKVEIFKADMNAGTWVPVVAGGDALLSQAGEALFLSRSFSKSTNAYGDLEEGLVYFVDVDQVLDTRTWACIPFRLPWQTKRAERELLTWFSPPKLVL
ncbi:hypothetical protein C2845_PM13G00450 [Panicum miliaceum]|uniref:F-box domain-containing protein n=1 Tax=Panicum miliaceum TaxID=4540 RepID=A0A3L6RGB6_PANMI|nr:hypothetical protein C2845_PM13G00450 [Panicum miliaceum]